MAAGAIYEAHTPRRTSIFNILADFAIRPMLPRSTPHKKLKDDDDDRDSPSRQGSNSDRAMHSSDSDQETREDEEYGLADVDKERRRKRLARNKQLDSRVALNNMTDANRDDIATAAVTRNIVLNVLLLLSWYANSIGISVVIPTKHIPVTYSLTSSSSTNGSCQQTSSTSTFPSSSPAFT